jgi:hypothetical protein
MRTLGVVMSHCRMPSTLALALAAAGLSGGPATPTAMAAPAKPASLPTAFSRFAVSLNQYGQLGYSGCLGLPAKTAVIPPAQLFRVRPTIQYAARPTGPWHTLTSATLTRGTCGNAGAGFSGRVTARLNLAYYRAYFPGQTTSSGTGYLATASPAVLAWKFEDRITSFLVSPVVVRGNGDLTVRGTLQYYHSGWRGYPDQAVLVILCPKTHCTWYWIRQVTTGPGGRFGVTFADPASATWSAEYLGNGTHLAAVAAMVYVPRE